MTRAPRVSVVIPAFQNVSTIAETVGSVLAQTFGDFELLVADHGSTDGTVDVLSELAQDPRVTVLTTPAGGGAEANWNRVTAAAVAPYLKLVCGDDLLYAECLDEQVRALAAHPSAALVAARRDVVDASGGLLLRSRGLGDLDGLVPGSDAIRAIARAGTNLLGEPACVLARTDAVRAAGGWLATEPYFIDVDLYVRLLRTGDLVALPTSLAAFRLSLDQWSARLVREQASQARRYYRRLHAEMPEVVDAATARQGAVRGTLAAYQRRAAYLIWRRRLRHRPAGPSLVSLTTSANGRNGRPT